MLRKLGGQLRAVNCLLLTVCSATSMAVATDGRRCLTKRLPHVDGDHGKMNDVVFCGEQKPANANVIFFSGDVQDYKENMLTHRDNRRYAQWDIESTATLICRRFPNSHVWVVKASTMMLGTFNIYSNFVRWTDLDGAIAPGPSHKAGQRSWHHLQKLITNSVNQMNRCSEKDCNVPGHSASDTGHYSSQIYCSTLPVILVGFSKGCVVLNQLAYDLADTVHKQDCTEDDGRAQEFARLVRAAYWLDGGHSGGKETWVTRDEVLASLSSIEVHSHVTPYQINDPGRPWLGKEQKRFISGLQKHGAKVQNTVHFKNDGRSLENHFNVLTVF